MSGLVRLTRLDLWTRRRGFGKASLVSFKVNPRLRLGLTLNSTRLAFLEVKRTIDLFLYEKRCALFYYTVRPPCGWDRILLGKKKNALKTR